MNCLAKAVVIPTLALTTIIGVWTYIDMHDLSNKPYLAEVKAQGLLEEEAISRAIQMVVMLGPFIFLTVFVIYSILVDYKNRQRAK